jgi:hypothetical protein
MSYRRPLLKRSAVAMIGVVALVIPAIASGSGYPTSLGRHKYASENSVKLAGDRGATIGVEGITNGKGQVITAFGGDIEHVPIKCSQGTDRAVGSDSLATVETSGRVSHSGAFTYKEDLTPAGFTGITVAVHGRFLDHGKKIKGTAVVTENPSPASQPTGTGAEDTGCTVSRAPHKWSGNVHWIRSLF